MGRLLIAGQRGAPLDALVAAWHPEHLVVPYSPGETDWSAAADVALAVVDLAAGEPWALPFLRAVRARFPACPIVALYPAARRDEARGALCAGADAVLETPCDLETLRALIATALRRGAAPGGSGGSVIVLGGTASPLHAAAKVALPHLAVVAVEPGEPLVLGASADAAGAPRLLLVDLARAAGFEGPVLDLLRRRHPHCPALVVYDAGHAAAAAAALQHGADAVLPSPFGLDELVALVRRLAGPDREDREPALAAAAPAADTGAEDYDALSLLVRSLAHEVNNPLTTIRGFLQLLATESKAALSKEDARDAYRTMQEHAQRIGDVVQELEYFTGQRKPKRTLVDLHLLLGESLRTHGLADVEPIVSGETLVLADRDQLAMALDHLLGYLADTDPEGKPEIDAALVRGADRLSLTVSGRSNSAHDPDPSRLLLPLTSSGRTKGRHSLARVFGIARSHGGSLQARRDGQDRLVLDLQLPS